MTIRSGESVELTDEIDSLIGAASPVAVGVSGGKDSCAAAFAVSRHLDSVGHSGPRLLVHSDLGRIEWADSMRTCERLAARLGWELLVVRRQAGDMIDRWETRWSNNVARYASLSCVKLILPWSTPAMRFCTSELKTDVICRALALRFPGETIVSVSGVRRDESANRKGAPTAKPQPKLTSVTHRTAGLDWNPIADWSKGDVFACLAAERFALHEAYTVYNSSRVSCSFCILATRDDHAAASLCEGNQEAYRLLVSLEARSTFAFQGARWLGDLSPRLLTPGLRADLVRAKAKAAEREGAESAIPSHLLYTKGWPTCLPTPAEAELLAGVRRAVAGAVGLAVSFTEPGPILARYRELMEQAAAKAQTGPGAKAAGKATERDAVALPLFAGQVRAEGATGLQGAGAR